VGLINQTPTRKVGLINQTPTEEDSKSTEESNSYRNNQAAGLINQAPTLTINH